MAQSSKFNDNVSSIQMEIRLTPITHHVGNVLVSVELPDLIAASVTV